MLSLFYTATIFAVNLPDAEKSTKKVLDALDTIFALKKGSKSSIENKKNIIYSPVGFYNILLNLRQVLCGISATKVDSKLEGLAVDLYNSSYYLSNNNNNLQKITAILTANSVTPEAHKKMKSLGVILGEKVLSANKKINTKFKKKVLTSFKKILQRAQEEDYSTFWEDKTKNFLKIVSVTKFTGVWQQDNFRVIDPRPFVVSNIQISYPQFIEKEVINTKVIDIKSGWQATRLFYNNNYVIDFILPSTHYNNFFIGEEKLIICKFVNSLNKNQGRYNKISQVLVKIPKFNLTQNNCLTREFKRLFFYNIDIDAKDYNEFLVNAEQSLIPTLTQKCYISIDEKGSDIQETDEKNLFSKAVYGGIAIYDNFIVDRPFFFLISEVSVTSDDYYDREYIIEDIIMLGKIENPVASGS